MILPRNLYIFINLPFFIDKYHYKLKDWKIRKLKDCVLEFICYALLTSYFIYLVIASDNFFQKNQFESMLGHSVGIFLDLNNH